MNNKFVDSIYLNDGQAFKPAYSFIKAKSSGMFYNEANYIGISLHENQVIGFYPNKCDIMKPLKLSANPIDNGILISDADGNASWKLKSASGSVMWNTIYNNLNTPTELDIAVPAMDSVPNIIISKEAGSHLANHEFYIKNKTSTSFKLCSSIPAVQNVVDAEVIEFACVRLNNSKIGICYYDIVKDRIEYTYSTDSMGKAWTTPISVNNDSAVGFLDMALVDGYPAIAYIYDDGPDDEWRFIRASNIDGSAWETPVTLVTATSDMNFQNTAVFLKILNGNPAVFYNDETGRAKVIRASNSTGTLWAAPVNISNLSNHQILAVTLVNGNPAVCAKSNITNMIYYVRSTDTAGTVWPIGATQLYKANTLVGLTGNNGKSACTMDYVNNSLCIVMSELDSNSLYINRSLDAVGGLWSNFSFIVATNTELAYPIIARNNTSYILLYNDTIGSPSIKNTVDITNINTLTIKTDLFRGFDGFSGHAFIKNIDDDNNIIIFGQSASISLLRFYEDNFKINWLAES